MIEVTERGGFLILIKTCKKNPKNNVAFATGNGKVFTEKNYYIITCNLIACFE